ncbi:putative membrane protein [Smithella sp. ME-1]|uniref:Mj0042 family finger-like protein n=1 Tax=hydrocarbon metagenome TaxID=938273 RepID=A0A0W8FN73_9ZZZZ|nr:putative membrane protein [Smithella sp. ME-1]
MVIQCRQCRTKFRFDDSLMQGSGVWLKCSRCGHVYFQENPLLKKDADLSPEPVRSIKESESQTAAKTESKTETPHIFYRDVEGLHSFDKTIETKKYFDEEINLNTERKRDEDISMEQEEVEQKEISSSKSSGKNWKVAVGSVFIILIISVAIFFIFPQSGEQIIKNVLVYIGISEPARPEIAVPQMVKLQDVRHRVVNNYILGPIGVVEGTAVNRAEYPISRILIKGDILDAYSVVLGEHTSYAGNILTDDELTNLSEEEIFMKLSRPEGLNNSNDKIMPNGQIPFMVIFTHEPAGVIKATVVTVGAERLLSE